MLPFVLQYMAVPLFACCYPPPAPVDQQYRRGSATAAVDQPWMGTLKSTAFWALLLGGLVGAVGGKLGCDVHTVIKASIQSLGYAARRVLWSRAVRGPARHGWQGRQFGRSTNQGLRSVTGCPKRLCGPSKVISPCCNWYGVASVGRRD